MVVVTEIQNNLWGVVIKNKTKYEHKSERPIRITMASVDTSSVPANLFVPVMVEQGTNSFLLCTLCVPNALQQNLDLEVNKQETINIYTDGPGNIHLTGYYLADTIDEEENIQNFNNEMLQYYNNPHECDDEDCQDDLEGDFDDEDDDDEDEDDDDDEEDDDDDDDEDDDEEEEDNKIIEKIESDKKGTKRKLNANEQKNESKKLKQETKGQSKKSKIQEEPEDDEDDEDDDDEDGDEDEDDDDEEEEEAPKLVKPAETKQNNQAANQKSQQTKKIDGVELKDIKVGHGPEAKKGKFVHVYYTGKLKQNGKVFDSCTSGKPFKFRLGAGEVIPGWDIGCLGMKVGGKRTLTIPPNKAYGNRKSGPIPANSTLIFDIEVKSVS